MALSAVICTAFLAWHIPLAYRTPTGMDEDLFAVTGTSILKTGLPQVPYVPVRSRTSAYFKADRILYALPPLSFYLQALVQSVLGNGIGPARMASVLEALIAAWLVGDMAARWCGGGGTRYWAMICFLFGRCVFFPSSTARPDMAATMFGILAIWLLTRGQGQGRVASASLLSGLACGASLLCHPMGIVPSLQVGCWILWNAHGWREKLLRSVSAGVGAVVVLIPWEFLISIDPEVFQIQFQNNVLGRAGEGLTKTLLWPWPVVALQCQEFASRAMGLQTFLAVAATCWLIWKASRDPSRRPLFFHLIFSYVVLILFIGRHLILGYFAYPWAFLSIAIAGMLHDLAAAIGRPRLTHGFMTLGLVAALLPGSGANVVLQAWNHRDDPRFNAQTLATQIHAELADSTGTIAADRTFILELYLRKHDVVSSYYLPDIPKGIDYVLATEDGLEQSRIDERALIPIKTYGVPKDAFQPEMTLYWVVPWAPLVKPIVDGGPPP